MQTQTCVSHESAVSRYSSALHPDARTKTTGVVPDSPPPLILRILSASHSTCVLNLSASHCLPLCPRGQIRFAKFLREFPTKPRLKHGTFATCAAPDAMQPWPPWPVPPPTPLPTSLPLLGPLRRSLNTSNLPPACCRDMSPFSARNAPSPDTHMAPSSS